MSDSTSGPLNLVDQGTVLMLSVSVGFLIIVLIYFACLWYRKHRASKTRPSSTSGGSQSKSKSNVARSFSRFSQVDEELTFYADETDIELPEVSGQAAGANKPPSVSPKRNHQIKRSRAATQGTRNSAHAQKSRENRKSAPPGDRKYLETAM